MDVHVSLTDRRDLAGEIYRQLRAAILDGRLQAGAALPPTRELAARLSVSRATVNVAYDRLISEGFAAARVGSGTYVADDLARNAQRHTTRATALQPRALWRDVPLPVDLWRATQFDFRAGLPDAREFPYATWRRLLAREFRPLSGAGGYARPEGHAGLREAIARHLAIARGVHVEADDVIITNGVQQAIDLIARVLAAPGEHVAVEDPGYGPPRRLLSALGIHVEPTPVDEEGLVVEAISPKARVVYVSPSHQFPLGMSMSLQRRMALLEWARRTNSAIIEDDYDSEFRFGGRPIEPIHLLDHHGRVIYVGSFSKTMLPTLRLGFVIAPHSLRDALVAAKYLADWHAPLAVQAAMARFIDEGLFQRHVRRMRAKYAARRDVILEVLDKTFAEELRVAPSHVGLHVTALARHASVEQIAAVVQRASSLGFECTPVSMYAASAARLSGLVLGYGAIELQQIEAGLRVLRKAFDECARSKPSHA